MPCWVLSVTLSDLNVALLIVLAVAVAFFLFGAWKTLESHRAKVTTGREGLIGQTGKAISDLEPEGQVEVRGEIWRAVAVGKSIREGSRVAVVEEKDLTLYVRES